MQEQIADLRRDLAIAKSEMAIAKSEIATVKEKLAQREVVKSDAPKIRDRNESPPALTKDQIDALNQVISRCVGWVRDQGPKDFTGKFWTEFDAYYNVSSGRVENNVTLNGGMPPLFAFNKCMASNGVPLH
jgi:hypothetical protein